MNGYELAEELQNMDVYREEGGILEQAAYKLRQLQMERDRLFSAHSHEMVRADELQIECDRLYRVIELNGKLI
jgi:hypothetical protein